MKNLKEINGAKMLSTLKDPFKEDSVEEIHFVYGTPLFEDSFKWCATVYFKNGNTKGSHRTEKYDTFEECYKEIEAVLQNL